ncbi:unnamed protein product [Ostreobium quekettii]|uniref:Uncharacterized protein n=1 Tax=Ostreobium quekettii TaxID=121088 RepID=A0A8S1J0A9_9CHLO|nr:unnamed protein product [Ostreobium quekettii]|eukprot:evm.model.scf_435.6 EVM.evm.TU.scf_435.6   scf_435:39979-44876(+)
MSSGPTPAELRSWRKEAQRQIRLATNCLRGATRKWEAACAEGLDAARELSNALLTTRHLDALQVEELFDMPGLKAACTGKLERQQASAIAKIEAILGQLKDIVVEISQGCNNVHELTGKYSHIAAHVQRQPVFATLTFSIIDEMFLGAKAAYDAELLARTTVVDALKHVHTGTVDGATSEYGDLRKKLLIALLAWQTGVHLDVDEMKHVIEALTQEVHTT